MIAIERGVEPTGLAKRRIAQLESVGPERPSRTPSHRNAYNSVKDDLAHAQYRKCCYCERVVTRAFHDVEHYRPFARYWWLAWTWENLLFACAPCNRSGKNDAFPLDDGSVALVYDQQPPGEERPLLVDPAAEDPSVHIGFQLINGAWRPIGLTPRGRKTLEILAFDDDYRDDVKCHVDAVMERVRAWRLHEGSTTPVSLAAWDHLIRPLLDPHRPFRALTAAVLEREFPSFPQPPT